MKLRKLIRADVLQDLHADVKRGVPVALAMRKYLPSKSMTRPTVVKLLAANQLLLTTREFAELDSSHLGLADLLAGSLFPAWLEPTGEAVQQEPYDYSYEGEFPRGKWKCATLNHS